MRVILPEEIERKSFQIIDSHIPKGVYTNEEYVIVRKIIHATADFSLRKNIFFSENAISLGLEKLKENANIFTDVMMVASGISPSNLLNYKGKIICCNREEEVKEIAKKYEITRSAAAVKFAVANYDNIGIFAIGNAPTALFELLNLAREGKIKNALIIGACVGMVGAAESKRKLINSGLSCIAIKGKRGGSPIAATIVNGLFTILKNTSDGGHYEKE